LLSPGFRDVVVLRYLCDLDYEGIAETLQIPLGTVRSRLARALGELRVTLGNFPDGAGVSI
jgi:DNA-directed RNA polymerase specialized sigma24 family protein